MLINEIAIESSQDRGLWNLLAELEVLFCQGFCFGKPRFTQPRVECLLVAGSLLQSDQYCQNLQKRGPPCEPRRPGLAVALGDLRKFQLGQVAVEPCLAILISSPRESSSLV